MEERALWSAWKEQKDIAARDRLIVANMHIVRYIAGRMAIHVPQCIELNDLVGWGVLGLIDAVDKYDHRQDIKFTTYASIRVRGAIIDHIRSLDWAPRSLRAMARKLGAAREKLRFEKGFEPDDDALATELGTTADHVQDTLAQLQTAHVLSLDDYLPNEERQDARKITLVSDHNAPSPEDSMDAKERQEQIIAAITRLPDQQRKVLHLYYYEELTLKEIGVVLEVSESRICQIHTAAMKTLRKMLQEAE